MICLVHLSLSMKILGVQLDYEYLHVAEDICNRLGLLFILQHENDNTPVIIFIRW